MENNIEVLMSEISKLKLESDRWRLVREDLSQFKKKVIEGKKQKLHNSKSELINHFEKREIYENGNYYHCGTKIEKDINKEAIGYLELILNIHDKLREKEDEALRSIYNEYKSLICNEKIIVKKEVYNYQSKYEIRSSSYVLSSLEKFLNLHDEIFELEKEIEDGRFFPCEEISSIEKMKKELDKFLLVEKELKDLKEANSDLEFELEKIEKELNLERKKLEIERNTNLEMLKKLEILNEDKLKANLAIKDNIIKNLEEKFAQLETKYSELIINES